MSEENHFYRNTKGLGSDLNLYRFLSSEISHWSINLNINNFLILSR